MLQQHRAAISRAALFNLFQAVQQAFVHAAKAAVAHAKQVVTRLNLCHHLTHQLIDVACHLGFAAHAALAVMGHKAQVAANLDDLVSQVMAQVQPGDHLLCMSNGGFGGVHDRLLNALKQI